MRDPGKIKKTPYLIIVITIGLVFVLFSKNSLARSSRDSQPVFSQINSFEYLQKNLLPSLPMNSRGLFSNTATGSFRDLKLLNTEGLSSGNLVSALKSVAVLAINLFLIVIQVVVGILKALLPFLSK